MKINLWCLLVLMVCLSGSGYAADAVEEFVEMVEDKTLIVQDWLFIV